MSATATRRLRDTYIAAQRLGPRGRAPRGAEAKGADAPARRLRDINKERLRCCFARA